MRLSTLSPSARLFLLHSALLTFGLSISSLFSNLLLVGLGYDRPNIPVPWLGDFALLGLLNSLPVLTAGLSSPLMWWLASRSKLQYALLIGAACQLLPLLALALAPTPPLLLAGTLISGPAAVLFQISAAPLMMRASGASDRDLLFSLHAGIGIGIGGLGNLIGGLIPNLTMRLFGLETQNEAYQATFGIAAGVVCISLLPLLFIRELPSAEPAAPAKAKQPPWEEVIPILMARPWNTLRFLITPAIISCGAALLIPYLNIYFRQRFAAPDEQLGLIFAAIGITTGVATLVAPLLSQRFGKPGSVALTQALAIPCLILLGLAPYLVLAAFIALVRASLMNMATPLYNAFAMEETPDAARVAVMGLIGAASSAGYVLGPTISAQVQAHYGFAPLFMATAACYTVAALLNYFFFVRKASSA